MRGVAPPLLPLLIVVTSCFVSKGWGQSSLEDHVGTWGRSIAALGAAGGVGQRAWLALTGRPLSLPLHRRALGGRLPTCMDMDNATDCQADWGRPKGDHLHQRGDRVQQHGHQGAVRECRCGFRGSIGVRGCDPPGSITHVQAQGAAPSSPSSWPWLVAQQQSSASCADPFGQYGQYAANVLCVRRWVVHRTQPQPPQPSHGPVHSACPATGLGLVID